jgi:hypothetical protein
MEYHCIDSGLCAKTSTSNGPDILLSASLSIDGKLAGNIQDSCPLIPRVSQGFSRNQKFWYTIASVHQALFVRQGDQ